jgi:hypothetical protein
MSPDRCCFCQCDAGPLAISGGTFALAAVVAIQVLAGTRDKQTQIIVTGVLLIACIICSISSFATSLYRWGEQWESSIGPSVDNSRLYWEKCTGTYSTARGDYKAMSAFGVITTLIALATCIVEFCFGATNQPMAAIQGGVDLPSSQEQFM